MLAVVAEGIWRPECQHAQVHAGMELLQGSKEKVWENETGDRGSRGEKLGWGHTPILGETPTYQTKTKHTQPK